MTLIERTVRAVRRQGVERVVVILGHDEAKVAEAARAAAPDSVEIVRAQGWESGNGSSLAAAKLTVSDESLFLLLVGDHLYGDAALDPLVTVGGTAALLDPHPLADVLVEATRVVVEDRTAVRFGRASRCCCPAHGCPPTWTWLAFALGVVAGALLALGAGAGGSTGDARRLRPGRRRRRAGPAPTAGQPRGPYSKASSTAWPTSPSSRGLGLWGLTQGLNPSITLGLAVAASAGSLLSMATKDRIAALKLPRAPERRLGFLLGGRDGRLLLVTVLALIGQPVLALAAVAMASLVSAVLRVALVHRGLAEFDSRPTSGR